MENKETTLNQSNEISIENNIELMLADIDADALVLGAARRC